MLPPMVSTSFVAAEAAAMDAVQRRLMFEDEYVVSFIFSLIHGRFVLLARPLRVTGVCDFGSGFAASRICVSWRPAFRVIR